MFCSVKGLTTDTECLVTRDSKITLQSFRHYNLLERNNILNWNPCLAHLCWVRLLNHMHTHSPPEGVGRRGSQQRNTERP